MIHSPTLPPNCTIRPAVKADRWVLQRLVLQLIWTEALGFDLRVISYRMIQILLLVTLVALEVWLVKQTTSPQWQSVFLAILIFTTVWAIAACLVLILYIVLIPIEPLFNWSMYWVVECNHHAVACAAVSWSHEVGVMYHVVVAVNWRRQRLASSLLHQLVGTTKTPLYLVCKPALVPFYRQFGFEPIAWKQLSQPLKNHFKDFARDRWISNIQWEIMAFSHGSTLLSH